MVYLDNASTTQVSLDLAHIINRYLYHDYGNAGNIHSFGIESKLAIDDARMKIAKAVSVAPENVVFTSSGSEANNLAILGLEPYLHINGFNHIITTKYEHHSVLESMKEMERRGFEVTYLDTPNGIVNYIDLLSEVREDTGLVSIMYVNNELGTKNDLKKIYSYCHNKGIVVHSDCVQAVGMEQINMENMADMISISGHKIHAPKGIGCLCAKNIDILSSIIHGGEQEFGIRAGTENVAFIAAFGEAMRIAKLHRGSNIVHIKNLKAAFVNEMNTLCEKSLIKLLFHASSDTSSSKICSMAIDGIDAETLVILLGDNDIFVSAGSACSSHSSKPSHVLKAIGLSDKTARETIRVSFSDYNTVEEVCIAARVIVDCIKELKGMTEVL